MQTKRCSASIQGFICRDLLFLLRRIYFPKGTCVLPKALVLPKGFAMPKGVNLPKEFAMPKGFVFRRNLYFRKELFRPDQRFPLWTCP